METQKGKYKLICVINNDVKNPFVLKRGNLDEIDNFIYQNKIKDEDDLYSKLISTYWEGSGTYKFNLVYKYKGERERPILYYDDISKIKNLSVINDIESSYFYNNEFRIVFLDKYVIPLLDIKSNKSKIQKYANDLYNNQKNITNFQKFLLAYISKFKNDKQNTSSFTSNEKSELESTKREVYYTKLRDIYSTLKFLNRDYTYPIIEDEEIPLDLRKFK